MRSRRPGPIPGQRLVDAQPGPGTDDGFGQSRQPAAQCGQVGLYVHPMCEMIDQISRVLPVAAGKGVGHGFLNQVFVLKPDAGPVVQLWRQGGAGLLQALA